MHIGQVDYLHTPEIKLSVQTGKEYIDAIMEQSDSESESDNNSEE